MPFAAMLLLVVRTYDVVNMPARELDTAKQVSARILQKAGIDVTWLDCGQPAVVAPDACATQPDADELLMRIVTAEGRHGVGPAVDALGYSYVDTATGTGTLATVYADRVRVMAAASGMDVGTIVGFVMAHEIGHLLLGSNAHQPHGLMSGRWSSSALRARAGRDWRFSRADVARLGTNLKRRKQLIEH